MTSQPEKELRSRLEHSSQAHVLRFWNTLSENGRQTLLAQLNAVDFDLMNRLIRTWVLNTPDREVFEDLRPVPLIPKPDISRSDAREARDAGEEALRQGRVGLVLVAGGQGTRLGFAGPKGAYPIGPISGRSLFAFHADKIRNLQQRYGIILPWYIMVSEANDADTRAFFNENNYFGLDEANVIFFRQGRVPCVDEDGKFMLEKPDRLAMNPNGHGGCIPALVQNDITRDARDRGIDTLSYFQVDNWAVKVADPFFIGYHVLREAEMSCKCHTKRAPREPVGVYCICDGVHQVIEYSELDIYPQLLEKDDDGRLRFAAGNPAIHILDVNFIERVFQNYDDFPWHRAHKRIPRVKEDGVTVEPDEPNGYKFETFIFDALRFVEREPVYLEIDRMGEFTPIKNPEGDDSPESARAMMAEFWADWLAAAGCHVPRDDSGAAAVHIEISPQFALTQEEFVRKSSGRDWPCDKDIGIGPDGALLHNPS